MSIQDFNFNMARAITEQLVEQFGRMEAGKLSAEATASARPEPGVYLLYLDHQLVYVGKSDRNLAGRLERHRRALSGRRNISLDRITFKALHIHQNWSASTTETALIQHYGQTEWNSSGFGSNDPGRRRDETFVLPNSFDGRFPIDPDHEVTIQAGRFVASELLVQLKAELPYLLRYETIGADDCEIDIPEGPTTARLLLRRIAEALGDQWQVTALPGRILMYRESKTYAHGEVIWPVRDQ